MAKAILICGKVGSGKTHFAKKLLKKGGAVLLSVDEIMLSLFGNDAGDKHGFYAEKTQKYLLEKSLEILASGIDVILDWGFWKRESRDEARRFYAKAGFNCELYYISVSERDWRRNLAERNAEFDADNPTAYYIDDTVAELFASCFEPPSDDEGAILIDNKVFKFHPTVEANIELLQSWQGDPEVRRWIYIDDWKEYFGAVSPNPEYYLYTVFSVGAPIAQIAAERIGDELSLMLIVEPQSRGKGVGRMVLLEMLTCSAALFGDVSHFAAYIHPNNTASIKCFESAGFECKGSDPDGELIYRL